MIFVVDFETFRSMKPGDISWIFVLITRVEDQLPLYELFAPISNGNIVKTTYIPISAEDEAMFIERELNDTQRIKYVSAVENEMPSFIISPALTPRTTENGTR